MRFTSFEDYCKDKGIVTGLILPNVDLFPKQHQAALTATAKLYLLAEEINDGWKPDWNNGDERKWYPWFDLEKHPVNNPTGFRFCAAYVYYASSRVGSRLCFRSREDAEFAGETYLDLYRAMMILD